MSPEHGPRRSQVVLVEPALSQLQKLTAAETHRLDRAIVAIRVNPELGALVPDTLLRDYVDDVDGVRVIYYVTALRTVVIRGSRSVFAGEGRKAA
ncbi:hypothetical protein [Streptomyces sp. NPDC046727]|uniref:hypothetical protein n=1 Tax=Streptomyces sp. NPDC046727 TaxID=3155373 RepID=UPI00340AF163